LSTTCRPAALEITPELAVFARKHQRKGIDLLGEAGLIDTTSKAGVAEPGVCDCAGAVNSASATAVMTDRPKSRFIADLDALNSVTVKIVDPILRVERLKRHLALLKELR